MKSKTIGLDVSIGVQRSRATANSIHQRLDRVQQLLLEVQLLLSELDIADSTRPNEQLRPRSGYRFVHGTHSGTYKRDPHGTDPLPPGYTIPKG